MTPTQTAILIVGIILGVLLLLFAVFLFLIAPGMKRKKEMEKYTKVKYAHRGLHSETVAENSLSAFRAAVEAGYGIELDVRLSSDGVLVVFHDDTLERMTTESGRVDSKTAEELSKIRLADTEDSIPTFLEVLRVVDGKVPLLVEIKEDAMKTAVTHKTAEILKEYSGDYIVESFNPLSLAEFKKLMPGVLRGVLSENFMNEKQYRKPMYFLLECMLLNAACRPDFIAFNHKHFKNASLRLARGLFGVPTVAWTVRSPEEEKAAFAHKFDAVIFENYISDNTTEGN